MSGYITLIKFVGLFVVAPESEDSATTNFYYGVGRGLYITASVEDEAAYF
jgi:hypothetical protein